jgi:hypothetical protein
MPPERYGRTASRSPSAAGRWIGRSCRTAPWRPFTAAASFRVRLDGPPQPREFPILAELRAEGVTEYLGLPLPFSDGSWKAITFSTCAPGGFSDEQFAMLRSLEPNLARILEIQTLHRTTLTLLNTYVGPIAGGRVLDGAIKRGMCEAIRAVIWFCDLRDFTELSEKLPAVELVNLLNDYFGAMTDAVGRHGRSAEIHWRRTPCYFPAHRRQRHSDSRPGNGRRTGGRPPSTR